MVNRTDRVQVWASQLGANDFPPICAMTGRPAETWRRFRFATPPTWAYALLLLVCLGGIGFIAFAIVMAAIAQRASGYLPLTHGSRRLVDLVFWIPLTLLGLWVLLWTAAGITGLATSDPTLTNIAWVMFWVGLLALAGGLAGRLIVTALVGPRGKVMEPPPGHIEKLVELRNVHPSFVAAVRHMHATWAAQAPRPN